MGSLGTDSAIEASDVVIMNDNLEKIVTAINISKKTNKIIKENLIFALGVKNASISINVNRIIHYVRSSICRCRCNSTLYIKYITFT